MHFITRKQYCQKVFDNAVHGHKKYPASMKDTGYYG